MMYQPKFRVALLKMEKEVKDKERELASVLKNKTYVEGEIDRCKKEIREGFVRMEKERTITPFSVNASGESMHIYQRSLRETLAKIEAEAKYHRKEYQNLTMKRDWLKEQEREYEKNFYERIKKKEEREVEEIKRTQEFLRRGRHS
jgi:predicted  nucleic acid-binding Zn-ribbon protein